nr:ADP-L-glycero-D-manno-heptose-6-epimerase [uncultured bacterium]
MIIVTGGAGFIGSCVVAKLNELGRKDIFVVDHWDDQNLKGKNLANKKFVRFFDKQEFLELVKNDKISDPIECVIHMGACSSTTGEDRDYYMRNNFEYSCEMAKWSFLKKARFIYASSAATYGDGEVGYKDDIATIRQCRPLNYYGESKQLFDLWILENGLYDKVVGLKFFNVFGPNEQHKGDMRSVIAKTYLKVVQEGKISLFKSYRKDYRDGEQKRDFVYVKDVVDVIMFFMDHVKVNGIFNVGTGKARTWNDLARALFSAVDKSPVIQYVEMPESLRPRYQYFTEADMSSLFAAGYDKNFRSLEDAIVDYVSYLKNDRSW